MPRFAHIATARRALVRHFDQANLDLTLMAQPFVRGAGDAFVLDIQRTRRGEKFRMFAGPGDNRVLVLGRARSLRQLVLLVEEPRRRVVQTVSRYGSLPAGTRLLKTLEGGRRVIEFFTSAAKRHYLCGNDEQHLFVAQLRRPCTTVRDAHAALEAPALADLPRRGFDRPRRQGEWFFVVPSRGEVVELEDAIRRHLVAPRRKVSLASLTGGRAGNPHVAAEAVRLGEAAYARGSVRHPEHATLKLRAWHRVFANQEIALPSAIKWVD